MEKIRDEEYLKEHRKELQSLSVRARVRRLEMLRANIIRMADGLYNDLAKESTEEYAWDYDRAREKTAISLTDEKHLEKFSAVNSQKIKTLLEFPWSGENYSQKIWNCDDRFVKMLNRNLSLGLVTGQTYSQIIKNIQKECDAQKYQIERLVRTEGTFIANQGSLDTYSQLGVKKYRFVARLDSRTSPQCRELNGKVFNVSDAVAGENLPPLHPYCRSTTVAVFDEEENKPLDTNKIDVKTVGASKIKSDFKPIRGINNNAPKVDKNGEKRYNKIYELSEQDKIDIINGKYPNRIKVDSFSEHFYEREEERKVSPEDIKNALKNPLKITEIKPDKYGGSYKVISETATVVINPTTNNMITVYKTHSKLIKKLKK